MKTVFEAQVESIATRVDGTVTVKIGSQELDSSQAAELFHFRGKHIKVLISDTNINKLQEEAIDSTSLTVEKKGKTPSQRFRAVLWRVNEYNGGDKDSFDAFYNSEMERLIEHYKKKLE